MSLGPFGAYMTLLYGLTAAPAFQPRNALCGQALSLTIAISIGYADSLEIWLRQSLATTLAVASMVKLGWTHPPAGAAALIFSDGYKWGNMAFMLLGNVIAFLAAALINNMSDKRQYPSFWGLKPVEDFSRMATSGAIWLLCFWETSLQSLQQP
jgi:CBS-domain-containing membrane protein